jgi:pimeloyl-ACP methyl ester carboxylesterase
MAIPVEVAPMFRSGGWRGLILACAWALLVLAGCGAAAPVRRTVTVSAPDGFPLATHWLASTPQEDSPSPRALVLYVDETEPASVRQRARELQSFGRMGIDVVLVEPRGVDREGFVLRDVFLRADTKQQRIADVRAVLDAYRRRIPADLPVLLLAVGRDGGVAARLARETELSGLLLLGVGGGWSQADELRYFSQFCVDPVRSGPLERLEARFADILANPESSRLWLDHPYWHWASYLWDVPLDDLRGLDLPILMIHGDRDSRVPVQSARAVRDGFVRLGKSNLTYLEYPGVNQLWRYAATGKSALPRLRRDVVHWLQTGS